MLYQRNLKYLPITLLVQAVISILVQIRNIRYILLLVIKITSNTQVHASIMIRYCIVHAVVMLYQRNLKYLPIPLLVQAVISILVQIRNKRYILLNKNYHFIKNEIKKKNIFLLPQGPHSRLKIGG